ncbi:c-type cytochrome [Rhizobacter sp. J219]|jgi:sulfide dehydrogenase cytochrome subunit|uniref:c-type cytochrome n=1 Tax=Rhizobacter sp. J219 TaxID=2898430 RepID=UPI0021518C91|nr:c-type cytochrome [Rhizobacter sp. J219]MCR5884921.1 c-type cytochrome [Rhizobacter sp. J219]
MARRRHAGMFLAGLLAASSVPAQPGGDLATRSLAATCAACHGTDGRAVSGAGMVSLRGLDRQYLQSQLTAFRDGTRPATVMHQIAKGYTPEQIEQLAAYFSALPRVAP